MALALLRWVLLAVLLGTVALYVSLARRDRP